MPYVTQSFQPPQQHNGPQQESRKLPFILNEEHREIVEPVFLFFRHHFVRNIAGSPATTQAYVHDLCDYWNFLEAVELRWNEITTETLFEYRNSMLRQISPVTGREYAIATIHRRLSTIIKFYRWATRNGRVVNRLQSELVEDHSCSIDRLLLAHVATPRAREVIPDLIPNRAFGPDDQVNPLSPSQLEVVMKNLGPLPTEREPAIPWCKVRNRLVAEVAVNSGLRREEIAMLTVDQILDLEYEEDPVSKVHSLRLTKTKGGRKRSVPLINWLVGELREYVAKGRKLAEKTAVNLYPTYRKTNRLFLNDVSSPRFVGHPLSLHTISVSFHNAVNASGLTREVTVNFKGAIGIEQETRFRFHDLRHTFAVYWYHSALASGNPDPLKELQTILGHNQLSTTSDTYLRHAELIESVVSDRLLETFASLQRLRSSYA